MPPFGPIKRQKLIRSLRRAGFSGPFAKRRHAIMVKGELTITIPNPHRGDISGDLLARILREAEITRETWQRL